MSENEVSLATIKSICEKKESIPILRCLNAAGEPLRVCEIEEISGVGYDLCLSIVYRLVNVGILSLHKTAFNKRVLYFQIENEEAVKQVLNYFGKQKRYEETTQPPSGKAEEV
jgi:hypothetical protein